MDQNDMGAADPVATPTKAGPQGEPDSTVLALYQAELGLVSAIAKRIFSAINGLVEFDELRSAGNEGLYQAAIRFEPTHGVQFRTYAHYRIRGAIMDAVRKASWLPRRTQEKARAFEAAGHIAEGSVASVFTSIDDADRRHAKQESLEGYLASIAVAVAIATSELAGCESADPEEACAREELIGIVQDALPELNEMESNVIRLRYFEHRDLAETARALGVRKPWASRLESRALGRLAKRLQQLGAHR